MLLEALRNNTEGSPVRALEGTIDYPHIRARQIVYADSLDWKTAIAHTPIG